MPPAGIDVAIFCATKLEASAARGGQRGPVDPVDCGGKTGTIARLGSLRSLVAMSGVEAGRLEATFEAILRLGAPRLLINFGAAGAIDPDLEVGAATVPGEVVSFGWPRLEPHGQPIQVDAAAAQALGPDIRITRAGSCPHPVCDAKVRVRLRERLRIDTTDCETYRLAALCRSHGIGFLALRCVTDRADASARESHDLRAPEVLCEGSKFLEPLAGAWLGRSDRKGQ